ncbi:MAG TPA: hypothetical protein VF988_07495, partial [Verrucomicrobiae bacterium]
SDQNPLYVLWQLMRNVADASVVLMLLGAIFLVMFGKYGAKRVVQRLVFVAVLINLSYFIVSFGVDLFNILGSGFSQLVMAALQQAGTTQLNGDSAGPVRSIFTVGGAALLAVVVTGGSDAGRKGREPIKSQLASSWRR